MELEVLLPSRVTVVTAPAGFGKTSYLTRLRSRPGTVWVDTALDDDPVAPVELALGPPARRVLVVDDAHLMSPDGDAVRILAGAVASGSAPTRIALVGRPPLPVPISAAAVRGGDVTLVTETALGLDLGRTRSLLEARLGPGSVGLAERLQVLTGGWPALTSLAVDAAAEGSASDLIEACFARGGAGLLYVDQVVLAGLPTRLRKVLGLTARLGSTPEDAFAGAGLDHPGTAVEDLVRRGLLVRSPADGRVVELPSHLGAAFGRALVGAARPAGSLRRLAAYFEESGDPLRALDVWTMLGDEEAVVNLLARHGEYVLRQGRVAGLVEAISSLPAHQRSRVLLFEGQARQVLGDHDGALDCYRRLAGEDGQRELDPGLAWRMGVIHYLRGEPTEALACYRRGRLDDETTPEEAQLLAWMASAAWISGDADACLGFARRAHAAARSCRDDSALASAHVALALHAGLVGVRRELNEHYDRALEHAERAGDRLQIVRVCANRGSHLVDEGHLERALEDLELARTTAREAHFAAFEGLCEVNTGEAQLRLGRLAEAEAAFARAQAIYQRMGSRKIAYALNGLGEVHLLRGAATLARAAYTEALEVSESGEDVQALTPALTGLARVLSLIDRDAALTLARRGVDLPGAGRARAWLTLGWLVRADDAQEAETLSGRAAEEAARHRDWVTLAEAHELQAVLAEGDRRRRLLREAEHAWRESGCVLGAARLRYARSVLAHGTAADRQGREARLELDRIGVSVEAPQPAGLLAALPIVASGRVGIVTLGRFAVLRDGQPTAGPMAQSRKARELLKILLARGGPVPREELMSLLWPGEDAAVLGNRLAVAVRAVRRSLDPDHERPADWVLAGGGDSLSLDLGDVDVDVDAFLSDAAAALKLAQSDGAGAVAALEAAVSRYTGDFLEEDVYDAWAQPRRTEARSALVACLNTLAGLAGARGDSTGQALWAGRAGRADPAAAGDAQSPVDVPAPRQGVRGRSPA